MDRFHLSLFLVPWITYRESRSCSAEAVNSTQGELFCFLVIMTQRILSRLWRGRAMDTQKLCWTFHSFSYLGHFSLQSQKLPLSSVVNTCAYNGSTVPKEGTPRGGCSGGRGDVKREKKVRKQRETLLHFKHVGISHMFHLKMYSYIDIFVLNDNQDEVILDILW